MKIFVVASASIWNDYFPVPAIDGVFKDEQEALEYAKSGASVKFRNQKKV